MTLLFDSKLVIESLELVFFSLQINSGGQYNIIIIISIILHLSKA